MGFRFGGHQVMLERSNPVDEFYRAFERDLENPYSEASKMLANLRFRISNEELLKQLIINFDIQQKVAEEKQAQAQHESNALRKQEKEKQSEQRAEYNEAVRVESEQTAKLIAEQTGEKLRQDMTVHVENIKKLGENLHQYEDSKKVIDQKIEAIDREIAPLEKEWKETQEKIADAFINDNFIKNEFGKHVSAKNPAIELLDGAVDVIKNIFADSKSPAEMQVHNPTLIDHPERITVQDDVRKELRVAKKIDKIVDKNVKDEINKKRKIMVKEVVLDDNGKPVMEIDANGKEKVKTKLVELQPRSRKDIKASDVARTNESRTTYAADDSAPEAARKTKREGAKLVCVGDVCFMVDHLMAKSLQESAQPIVDNDQHRELTNALLQKGEEKRPLINERDALIDRIAQTKVEIERETEIVVQDYADLVDMHQAPHIASPLSMRPTPDSGTTRIVDATKKSAEAVSKMVKNLPSTADEQAPDEKPPRPRHGH